MDEYNLRFATIRHWLSVDWNMTQAETENLVSGNEYMIDVCRRNGIYNRVIAAKLAAMSKFERWPLMASIGEVKQSLVNQTGIDDKKVNDFVNGNKDEVQKLINKGLSAQTIAAELACKLKPDGTDNYEDKDSGSEDGSK